LTATAQQLKNNSMADDSEYKKHYEQFSQNVAFAARTWHHHVHLNNRANEDPAILAALNKSPRYWLDHPPDSTGPASHFHHYSDSLSVANRCPFLHRIAMRGASHGTHQNDGNA
jgi:hypothetical protein